MSCKHPIPAVQYVDPETGALGTPVFQRGDRGYLEGWFYKPLSDFGPYAVSKMLIPCGQCAECRRTRAHGWADRLMLEAMQQGLDRTWFVTLTYSDDELPDRDALILDRDSLQPITGTGVIRMSDVSAFIKRLRSRLGVPGLRFYAAGEYSPQRRRPHYHVILYADLPDVRQSKPTDGGAVFLPLGSGWSETIEKAWGHGLTDCSPAGSYAMSYVAGYVVKKFKGKQEDDYQELLDRMRSMLPDLKEQPIEDAVMSRRPGLGAPWIAAHPELCKSGFVALPAPGGARRAPLPRIAEFYLPRDMTNTYKDNKRARAMDSMQRQIQTLDGRRTLFAQAEIDEYVYNSKQRLRSASSKLL